MITPFTIEVDERELAELRRRLLSSRFADAVVEDWSLGIPPAEVRRFVDYWASDFRWRSVEERLNAQNHVLVRVDDGDGGATRVHVLRAGTRGKPPLLLLHGWPDSFLRFERLIPLLAADHELIVPSIPGYGFSDRPTRLGAGPQWVADRMAEVMTELGHHRFGVHGGDIGSGIGEQLAVRHPQRVTALHLSDVPMGRLAGEDVAALEPEARAFVERVGAWRDAEGAYAHEQQTKPQTLAAALMDSPAGLAAWFLEKFHGWTDGHDPGSSIGADWLAANLTLYWVTKTAGSAARYYAERRPDAAEAARPVTVPVGFSQFPGDILTAPRSLAERWYPVERWTVMPRGGHFAALEVPELLAGELREFFAGRH